MIPPPKKKGSAIRPLLILRTDLKPYFQHSETEMVAKIPLQVGCHKEKSKRHKIS